MSYATVHSKDVYRIELSDSEALKIIELKEELVRIYELLLQYSLFCSSLIDFKKSMYAKCLELANGYIEDKFSSSQSFIEAENSVMHMSASIMKFSETLPSLLRDAMPEDPDISDWAVKAFNHMYDDQDGKYMLLTRLRNCIIHNKVSVIVSSGATRKMELSDAVLTLGYYIDFDRFLSKIEGKITKKQKGDLQNRKEALCIKNGSVDLVKLFSDIGRKLYSTIIEPKSQQIKESYELKRQAYLIYISKSLSININDLDSALVDSADGRLLYSAQLMSRIDSLVKNIPYPLNAMAVVIAPSTIK